MKDSFGNEIRNGDHITQIYNLLMTGTVQDKHVYVENCLHGKQKHRLDNYVNEDCIVINKHRYHEILEVIL